MNRRVILIVIARVHEVRLANLALIGNAPDGHGLLLGPCERGQQQTGQDGDDGDNHQQFDEGERQLTFELKGRGGFHNFEERHPNTGMLAFPASKLADAISRLANLANWM